MTSIAAAQLADWFDAHAAHLVLYARQWVSPQVAEDIVQEVFVRLAVQPAAPQNAKAWLLTSVRHAAFDAVKTSRRRYSRDQQKGDVRASAKTFAEPSQSAGLDAADVQIALAVLLAIEREVITSRIWAKATFEKIANIVGLPHLRLMVRAEIFIGTGRNDLYNGWYGGWP